MRIFFFTLLLAALAVAVGLGCGSTSGAVLSSLDGGGAVDAPVKESSTADVTPESATDSSPEGAADAGCDGAYDSDPANCGACGHGCLGGACVAGQCQPVLLATGFLAAAPVVDDTRVYRSVLDQDAGTVRSIKKDGSQPLTLATGLDAPYGVFVDTTNLFWDELSRNSIVKLAK
jgi:hypothetical protein